MGRWDRSVGLNKAQSVFKLASNCYTGEVCISQLRVPMHHLMAHLGYSDLVTTLIYTGLDFFELWSTYTSYLLAHV